MRRAGLAILATVLACAAAAAPRPALAQGAPGPAPVPASPQAPARGTAATPTPTPTGASRAGPATADPAVASVPDASRDMPLPGRRGAAPATQAAATPGPANRPAADAFDATRVAIALAAVLILIFFTQRVWKRLGLPGGGGRASQALQVVSRLNLAPKQQLLLVRVGRRCVLIGNSAAQMAPLCEIADPDEVASLIGQTAAEREGSITASFNAVLGGAEAQFDHADRGEAGARSPAAAGAFAHAPRDGNGAAALGAAPAGADAADIDGETQAIAQTREELSDLMERVRNLSKQFNGTPAR